MANQLSVKVGHFIGAVVDVRFLHFGRSALYEQNVVVGVRFAEIDVHEGENVDVGEFGVTDCRRGQN
jgi:hypothetical protein